MILTAELSKIEAMISRSPYRERLWLIERLIHQLRVETDSDSAPQSISAENKSGWLASDSQVQAEVREDETAHREIICPTSVESSAECGARLLQQARQRQEQWAMGITKVMEELVERFKNFPP